MTAYIRHLLVPFIGLISGCDRLSPAPVQLTARIVSTRPHDPAAYTQGLQWHEGSLFESTGLYGTSTVRKVDPASGAIISKHDLPGHVFGEGLTFHGGKIYVLTWREQTAFEMDPTALSVLKTFEYSGEGWGLTSDGTHLIASDGTSTLRFFDPADFSVQRKLRITENGQPVMNLNELEFVDGVIFANVYLTDRIIRINPGNGRVTGSLDLSSLRALLPQPNRAEVLNGIAYDPSTKNFLVTGKFWPLVFDVAISSK